LFGIAVIQNLALEVGENKKIVGKLRDAVSRLGTYTYSFTFLTFTFLSEAVWLNLDSKHSQLPGLRTTYSPWLEATLKKKLEVFPVF